MNQALPASFKRFPTWRDRAPLPSTKRRLLALLALAVALGVSLGKPEAADAQAPNVLVIVTDDQRAGTTSVMPKTRKWFWNRGRGFPKAFVTTPLCCPARASLFTGLYTHNHGVRNNGTSALPHDATVQRYLRDAGYRTAIVGKYLNGWRLSRNPPYFDRWAVARGSSYRDAEFNVDGELRTLDGYVTNVIASRGVRLLRSFEQSDAQPWFLYVAPIAPHKPSIPARKYATAPIPSWWRNPAVLERDRSDKPPWVRQVSASLGAVEAHRADQLRTLMSVDDLVQRLFLELGSLGERRGTIAFFLSDNGYMWAEHGVLTKRYPYTDSIRLPFAMRWPAHVAEGSTDRRFATNVDIAPTILAAAGISPLIPMDGRSLLDDWGRRDLFTEYWRDIHHREIPSWDAIRTRRVHYIQYYNDDRSRVIFREYYRLTDDPWQLRNLLYDGTPSNDPDTSRLRARIRSYKTCSGASCP